MTVRGFDGRLPISDPSRVSVVDIVALVATLAVFLVIRIRL